MLRSALIAVFALSLAALSACAPTEARERAAPDPQPEPVVDDEPAEAAGLPARGEYSCEITLAGETQAVTACAILEGDLPETLWFETVGGQMWIEGELSPAEAEGFVLAGDLFCAQGACDEPIDAVFTRSASGAYETRVDTSEGELVIALER